MTYDAASVAIVEVRHSDQLKAIACVRPFRQFIQAKQLRLRIPLVSSHQQHTVERRLNFWLRVCGCQAGAISFLVGLVWQAVRQWSAHAPIGEAVLFVGVVAVFAGILAKLMAVLTARALFVAKVNLFLWKIGAGTMAREFST